MKIRLQARVITFDSRQNAILLVRNPDAHFWYVPGGGQEEYEDIKQCALREMREETGLQVKLSRLLYVQELREKSENLVIMELFWLAELSKGQVFNSGHVDIDPEGGIAEAKWFTKDDLQNVTVYPQNLKDSFWMHISSFDGKEDPFIGTFSS